MLGKIHFEFCLILAMLFLAAIMAEAQAPSGKIVLPPGTAAFPSIGLAPSGEVSDTTKATGLIVVDGGVGIVIEGDLVGWFIPAGMGTDEILYASNTINGASNASILGTGTFGKLVSNSGVSGVDGTFTGNVAITGTVAGATYTTTHKGNRLGSHGGGLTAIPRSDANILMLNASATSWSGIGTAGTGDVWFRTATSGTPNGQIILFIDGKVSIGTISEKGKFTVSEGDSGLVTAYSDADTAVFENSSHAGITISPPGSANANIFFASGTDNVAAAIQYSNANFDMDFHVSEDTGGVNVKHFYVDGNGTNPAGTAAGEGNFISDGYDTHPSFAKKDGVVWKDKIKDAVTVEVKKPEDLVKTAIPVLYEFDRTRESYFKNPDDFQDEKSIRYEDIKDESGLVIERIPHEEIVKSATDIATAYNETVQAQPGKIGFIVETLDDRYLSRDENGEVVAVKQDMALLDIIKDLQARLAALENR